MLSYREFDFDLMARLARESPAEFASRREEILLEAIKAFRRPEDGRRIQAEIDAERLRTAPGEKTCVAIMQRMGSSLGRMSSLFADVHELARKERIKR